MARWMAFSMCCMSEGLITPAKGPRRRKDLSRVVICSHLAVEVSLRPPSPAGNLTCVGAGRRVVERGTTITSLAKRLRTSMETTRAGRLLMSPGCPGSLTRYISPRRGYGRGGRAGADMDPAYSQRRFADRAATLVHCRSSLRSAFERER